MNKPNYNFVDPATGYRLVPAVWPDGSSGAVLAPYRADEPHKCFYTLLNVHRRGPQFICHLCGRVYNMKRASWKRILTGKRKRSRVVRKGDRF